MHFYIYVPHKVPIAEGEYSTDSLITTKLGQCTSIGGYDIESQTTRDQVNRLLVIHVSRNLI